MGRYLPGSPIVGVFDETTNDFIEHTRELRITDNDVELVDITKPYGFVPTDAKVWFQQFTDDDGITREYLVTEAYIWSTIYPESKRLLTSGDNQSMELNKKSIKGNWTNLDKSSKRFFIINEAFIEKLCILGENYEPCFEGAQIKSNFSLHDEFEELRNMVYAMANDLKEFYNKGGTDVEDEVLNNEIVETPEVQETPAVEEEFTCHEDEKKKAEFAKDDAEDKKDEKNVDNSDEENKSENEEDMKDKEEEKKDKENNYSVASEEKIQYNLEEVAEYVALKADFDALSDKYSALEQDHNALLAEIEPLRTFKCEQDRKAKQEMIDSFYMLSDEDKKDVCENIDKYSLNDIEAQLAVICFHNKVNFSLDTTTDQKNEDIITNFSLNSNDSVDVPEWILAVQETAKNLI